MGRPGCAQEVRTQVPTYRQEKHWVPRPVCQGPFRHHIRSNARLPKWRGCAPRTRRCGAAANRSQLTARSLDGCRLGDSNRIVVANFIAFTISGDAIAQVAVNADSRTLRVAAGSV